MLIDHQGRRPAVSPTAHVARQALVSGDVRIRAGAVVLPGAIITADGGPVEIGENSVVMEQALVRGVRQHATSIGAHVLVGPFASIVGARLDDEVFVATGAAVFNGARLRRAASVAVHGVVHIGADLPPKTRVPIGWIAVGAPAQLHPPTDVEGVRAALDSSGGFLPTVFASDPEADRGTAMRDALSRYSRALGRHAGDWAVG